MKKINLAIIGVPGMVSLEMLKVLEESELQIANLTLFGLPPDEGKEITFRGTSIPIKVVGPGSFSQQDIVLIAAGGEASQILAPQAKQEGAIVIDNSSLWRLDPAVPLVIPEVNPEDLDWHQGIIANPNCSTIQMLVAIAPIHRKYGIKRIVVSTYQSASGAGGAGVAELEQQLRNYCQQKPLEVNTFAHQILFNLIPHIDVPQANDYTKEEMKMVWETHKMLDPNIEISPTAVRVPVFRSHSESINLELEQSYDVDELKELLRSSPGIVVIDDLAAAQYPQPFDVAGKNDVFVGRIRRDPTVEHGVNLWVVADNVRKGAALNAVQIAEELLKRNLIQ